MKDINRYLLSLVISGFLAFIVFFIGTKDSLVLEAVKPQLQQVAIQLNTVQINKPKKVALKKAQQQKPSLQEKVIKKEFSENITKKEVLLKEKPKEVTEEKEKKISPIRPRLEDLKDIVILEEELILEESIVLEEEAEEIAVSTETQGAILNNFALHYPRKALEDSIEGRVIVNIFLTELGSVVDVVLIESSGYDVLDKSAIEQSYDAVISPAINSRGEFVSSNLIVDIRFNLTDELPIID